MRHGVGHRRHRHGFQPAQAAELGVRFAKPIEHHGADQRLCIEFPARGPQGAAQGLVEPQFPPELVEGKNIAVRPRGFIDEFRGGIFCAPDRTVQAVDQRVEVFCSEFVEAAEVGHHTHTHLAAVVAERLDQLQILAVAGLGDARIHRVAMISDRYSINQCTKLTPRVTTEI